MSLLKTIMVGLAIAVFGVFALGATLIPALRASSISPAQALRVD